MQFLFENEHIQKACFPAQKAKTKPVKQKKEILKGRAENKNGSPLFELNSENSVLHEEELRRPPILINLKIKNENCSMALDTGGTVSVMSTRNFRKISNKQIHPTSVVSKTYNGDSLIPMEYVTVKVGYKYQIFYLNLYMVKENLDTILRRE